MGGVTSAAAFISGIIQPITDLVDNLHTSDEERIDAQTKALTIQVGLMGMLLDYESKLQAFQAQVITAEAQSESWLARNWRPATMLTFVALVVGHWTGLYVPENMTKDQIDQVYGLIQIGLGGYVIGRSGEKMVKAYASSKTPAES